MPGYVSYHTLTPVTESKLIKGGQLPPDAPLHIEIRLVPPNIAPFVSSLLEISDPASPNYGKYWTAQEVAEAFKPTDGAIESILHWLRTSDVTPRRLSRCHSGDCLAFHSTTAEATQLFHTRFHYFRHKDTGSFRANCEEYHIPRSIKPYVEYIAFSLIPPVSKRSPGGQPTPGRRVNERAQSDGQLNIDCAKSTVPSCLRALYNIPNNTAPQPNNSFGIYQPAGVTWLAEDMDLFFSRWQPSLVGKRPEVQSIDGGYMQTEVQIAPFNLEPNLDFQYSMALTDPQPVTNIQVGDLYQGGNFNHMLAAFDKFYCGSLNSSIDPVFPSSPGLGGYNKSTDCGTLSPPTVLSISYSDTEGAFPAQYLERQCTEFLKLGLLGTTVVVSSGDTGVEGGMQPGACINATTGVSNATNTGNFSPGWPAIPTPLFAETALYRESDNGSATLSSGGGFSNVFAVPPYQSDAVAEYMEQKHEHLADLGWTFNRGGRGFPDLSALGQSYLVAMHGNITTVHGTSASAPVVASMISMINNDRLAAGKSTVGFINQALYAHPEVFNDVVVGNNEGCGFRVAFPAANGWDPVTGLGTLDYQKARDMFMSLP
ncbi:alkaline serine protease [Seiridium cupressi]